MLLGSDCLVTFFDACNVFICNIYCTTKCHVLSLKQEHPDQEAAPPALASKFPTKYMASTALTSSSVNITFSNVFFNGGAVDLSSRRHTQLNIVLFWVLDLHAR
ncbi:hypothetical protein L1987_15856 [Smallanthus sonchifolius]|uniref:Uncharacterized protein n=1 Tax=Smallanthus sonchifolius TaxID=185202 RepID=A0ACB9J8Y0_9ASTR|nr:hypothetical protein L1987_15856 [Smallanthus sonchifolius]